MSSTQFTALDYLVLIGYLVGVTVLGSLFAVGQKNTKDFFLAGRNMGWLPVGISVLATNFSAISLLGSPGYIVTHDLVLMTGFLAAVWALPLTVVLFLRFFHQLQVVTAYEYIGKRFNAPLRTVSSFIFVALRVSWLATAMYATALALVQVVGMSLTACVLIVGVLSTIYAALGGMKAVIWTDVVQTFVLYGAIVLILIVCTFETPGGATQLWTTAEAGGRTKLLEGSWALDRPTTWAVLIGNTFIILASYGVDQVIVQRYFTTRDYRSLVRSVYAGMLITIPCLILLGLVGLAIYSFYTLQPHLVPPNLPPEQWLPRFIVQQLPAGISGLVVAGLFAATMSSVDSGINSLTAVTLIDLYRPWRERRTHAKTQTALAGGGTDKRPAERADLHLARWLTLFFGAGGTLLALFVGRLGTIMEITLKLNGVIAGVLLGVFLAGVATRRANAAGTLAGAAAGTAAVVMVAFAGKINFLWFSPIGTLATFAASLAFSLLFPPPPEEKLAGLTLYPDRPTA
jgi:solute:Na+ symporter, SSS family